jgi:DNA-binding transcriptional MocR family regulator
MLAALEQHFAGATWSRPQGGYFIWLELPDGVDAAELCSPRRGRHRSCSAPTSAAPTNTLRLAYSFVSPDEIELGVRAARRGALASCALATAAPARPAAATGSSCGWRGGSSMRPAP